MPHPPGSEDAGRGSDQESTGAGQKEIDRGIAKIGNRGIEDLRPLWFGSSMTRLPILAIPRPVRVLSSLTPPPKPHREDCQVAHESPQDYRQPPHPCIREPWQF